MSGRELLDLFQKAFCRSHLIGNEENGIIAALDLEGRLFTIVNGKVLNRVISSAIMSRSNKTMFHNPGGDVLWPAPEGTCFGYEYGTGSWRVPPSITGASWEVISDTPDSAVIRAEIDLINNRQLGIPCEFERHIEMKRNGNSLVQEVKEVIRYIGKKTLIKGEFLLAPWSLCQFDAGDDRKVIMPPPAENDIRDLYDQSENYRGVKDGFYLVDTLTKKKFQLGISANVPWIEYIAGKDFRVNRSAGKLPAGQYYIDIADAPPDQLPADWGVKYSIYCDPSGFMEIEACGGSPLILTPQTELSVNIKTTYSIGPNE